MGHHKELIDVILGILNSFNSRNNDLQGYWALGVLYRFAKYNNVQSLKFDLLNQIIEPEEANFYQIISEYHSKLDRLLNKKKMNLNCLQSAIITIDFGLYTKHHKKIKYPIGGPYVITGRLIDDRGKIFESIIYGKCRSRNPTQEQQSGRIAQ